MKKLFTHLEEEIPISKLEEYLDEFEKQTRWDCLSLFLHDKDSYLSIPCEHPFTRSGGCQNCHLCKAGNYNQKEILDYIKNNIIYSKRGNIIMK